MHAKPGLHYCILSCALYQRAVAALPRWIPEYFHTETWRAEIWEKRDIHCIGLNFETDTEKKISGRFPPLFFCPFLVSLS